MDQVKVKRTTHRMTEARALLIRENPFFGHLAMGLQLACAPCETACTDGMRLIFDPEFAERLTERELQFVILHEILHCVLDHCTRGKGLENFVYNIACDIVVNSMIFYMWGMDTFKVDGKVPMHLTPNGQEGRLFSAEKVYHMLRKDKKFQKKKVRMSGAPGKAGTVDRHDLWHGIHDNVRVRDLWKGRIVHAAKACGSDSGMPPVIREIASGLLKGARVDWRQILHDFIQQDCYDYTFLPPDRRFSDSDFYLPAYNVNEDNGTVNDVWVCVDTSGSISDMELHEVMAEILDAIRQTGLNGSLSFFDTSVTEPKPFTEKEDVKKMKPTGGRGTSFKVIFDYLKEHLYPDVPKAILIFTDGYANCPEESAALGVPVLWLIGKDGTTNLPWGKVTKL